MRNRVARRNAELAMANLRQPGDSLADYLLGGMGETDTNSGPACIHVGHPLSTGVDGYAGLQREVRQPCRIDGIGQSNPQKNSAHWIVELHGGPEPLSLIHI